VLFLHFSVAVPETTDLYIYILDAVHSVHVVSNHVATDKLTTQTGRMFTNELTRLSQ